MSKNIILLWILCSINVGYSFVKQGSVVDGVKAKTGTYAHSSILALMCNNNFYICGGSIIHQRFILTAGHCLYGCLLKNIAIRVGDVDAEHTELFGCQEYRIHKKFKGIAVPASMAYDIAMALTVEDFQYGPNLKRIAITKHPPEVKFAFVAGWGIAAEGALVAEKTLRYSKQEILDADTCKEMLIHSYPGTICAKPPIKSETKRYPASGDSGSALIVKGFIQIGIVSYRETLNDKTLCVYTHIPYFFKWIERTSQELYCQRKPG